MSGDGSGAPNPNPDPQGGAGGETVSKADHQRALDDMHKFKKLAVDTEKERNDLKTRLEALERDKKTADGDFKGLYETTKARLDEIEAEKKKLKDSMVLTQKHSAVQSALVKAGFKSEFLPLLDKESFDEVVFEATSAGRFLVTGADIFVDQYRKRYPSAFEAAKPPIINTGGGSDGSAGGDSDLTPGKLFTIEQECKKKGNMQPYYEAIKKYQEQKKKSAS
jgi:hypothetical protein